MRIAVISDSHDNIPAIDRALVYLKKEKIRMLIHCGDICAPETLEHIAKNFTGMIHAVIGNVDADVDSLQLISQKYSRLTIHGNVGAVEIEKRKIAFTHYPWIADTLAKQKKYDAVFYGHDHRAWEKKLGTTVVRNPGTLAGLFAKPTFAVYDTTTNLAKLILLERI